MKINRIRIEHLRNEAHYQFLLQVENLFASQPAVADIVPQQLAGLKALVELEGQLVDAIRVSGFTEKIAEADRLRDRLVVGINAAVTAFLHHYDPARVEAARAIELRLKSFHGDIEKKSYEEEAAAVKILVTDLETKYAAQVTLLDLGGWVNKLGAVQEEFDNLFARRNAEQANKPREKLRALRKRIDTAYRDIVGRIDAFTLLNGDQVCAVFIRRLNSEVDYFNEHIHHHAQKGIDRAFVETIPNQEYKNKPVTVFPEVFDGDKKLVFSVDYELSYHDNDRPGTAAVIIHGKGAYKGKKTVSFNISRRGLGGSLTLICSLLFALSLTAQENSDKYIESDVIPLAGKKGFSFETKAGDFVFKPFVLVQTSARMNYYDDEGLDLADQDNIANSGFEIGNALLGFSGKAFNKLTFNLTLNAAQSGDALLQQAWFDINLKDELRFRVGKFKTPFNQGYLVTLGETLFPVLPVSLTAPVNIPYSLNSVNPNIATGFDLGVQMHGVVCQKWEYRLGVFNGTGISVNGAKKTLSDDLGIPSLLYAARLAYMPQGAMPAHQGSSADLNNHKSLIALSSSYNVEANWQASNDFRAGLEFAYLYHRWYFTGEAYFLRMKFTKKQDIAKPYDFLGGYVQGGYFVTPKWQLAARYDFFNRNSFDTDGLLNLPACGVNYFIAGYNLKLQAMYQYLGKWGHADQLARDNDDLGLAQHTAQVMLQFSF